MPGWWQGRNKCSYLCEGSLSGLKRDKMHQVCLSRADILYKENAHPSFELQRAIVHSTTATSGSAKKKNEIKIHFWKLSWYYQQDWNHTMSKWWLQNMQPGLTEPQLVAKCETNGKKAGKKKLPCLWKCLEKSGMLQERQCRTSVGRSMLWKLVRRVL